MIDVGRLQRIARQLALPLGRKGAETAPGQRRIAVRGRGPTFVGHREYEYGDDVRHIDWNVSARLNRPHVKIFQQELAGSLIVLVDVSASMTGVPWGSSKLPMAHELAGLFALAGQAMGERVGGGLFTDRIEVQQPPGRGRDAALRFIRLVEAHRPRSTATNIAHVLERVLAGLKHPSVLVVISDFITPGWEAELRRVSLRHEVVGVALRDPREEQLPARRLVQLRDAESGTSRWVDSASAAVRGAYARFWVDLRARRRLAFERGQSPFIELDIHEPYLPVLRSTLMTVGGVKSRASH